MDLVRANFNDRKDEIDIYFEFIDFLDNIEKMENMEKSSYILYNKDVEKIIRANSLLMLYNLVESTLVTGMEEVYSALKENNITYGQVRSEIREIWFNYRFSNAYDRKAHYDTYKKTAEKIIESIMLNETLVLDRKATGISGNLDATSIRDVCKKHGIQFYTPGNCHGGEKLTKVKDQRNQLAHGTLSFVECGRYFTVEDLHVIKEEVENFLSGFIDSIESYYDNEEYLIK